MKNRILMPVLLISLCFVLSAQDRMESRITGVTVFADRVQVTRAAEFSLPRGERTLVFTDLPDKIDPESIQVKGSGNFMLTDVKLTTRFLSRIASERIRRLTEERKALEQELTIHADAVGEAESEKRFIENISKKLTAAGEGSSEAVLDPGKWFEMVAFYREKLVKLNGDLRGSRAAAGKLKEEIDRINREIQGAGADQNREVKEIQVVLQGNQEGPGRLELSYLVYGPSWKPDYTVRADGSSREVSLMYQALVRQSTGEDWTDVNMKLSTAKPQVSGRMPELSPWFITARKPQPARASRGGSAPGESAAPMAMEKALPQPEERKEPRPEMTYQTAAAVEGAAAVIFELGGKNSIAGDNQTHKVTVAVFGLKADFQYAAVPKFSPHAFLEADVVNDTEFPLLPGAGHIFLDGNYVADGRIDLVAPREKFKISLGIDERISVKRTLINRYEETSGFFTKKKKITYSYLMEITNNKRTREKLELRDQIPVAQSEEISVVLIEPKVTPDNPELKMRENAFLEWTRSLNPGETVQIPFSYSVEYPENMVISGLE
jgi:uncharacterized protein (TIGR02231 family)